MLDVFPAGAVCPTRAWCLSFTRGRSLLWLPQWPLVGRSPLARIRVVRASARQFFAPPLRRLRVWDRRSVLRWRLAGPGVLDVLLHGTPLQRHAPLWLRRRHWPLHRALRLVLPDGGVAGLIVVVALLKRLLPWPIGIVIAGVSTLVDR